MDFSNITSIQLAADHWQNQYNIPADYRRKVPCYRDGLRQFGQIGQISLGQSQTLVLFVMNMSCVQVKIMGSFMPKSSKYKGVLEVPDPWFDDDAERRGFYRVWHQPGCYARVYEDPR